MLTQAQFLTLVVSVFLIFGLGILHAVRRILRGEPLMLRYRHVRFPRRTSRLLRRCLFLKGDMPVLDRLHELSQPLAEALITLQQQMRTHPPVPWHMGEPRLMPLARAAVQRVCTPDSLHEALREWPGDPPLPSEILTFPDCAAAAVAEELCATLQRIRPAATQASRDTARQTELAEALQRAMDAMTHLRLLDTTAAAERSDPLHQVLSSDPSGIYGARMTAQSRLQLRLRTERLARLLRISPASVAEHALALCRNAEPHSLEQHIGYYLIEPAGVLALLRSMRIRRALPGCLLLAYARPIRRLATWILTIACFPFLLDTWNSLLMLPILLTVTGFTIRRLLSLGAHCDPPPCVQVEQINDDLRTLVVLPAVLHAPDDALRMLHHLKTFHSTMRNEQVDYLLIGDSPPALTLRTANDASVISAAAQGAAALCGTEQAGRFLYLHRSRQPGNARPSNAIRTVCQLIATGVCDDLFDYATFAPADLCRRYAFVLVLDGKSQPVPGMLHALLRAASHPLNTALPVPGGKRGYCCFRPAIIRADDGSFPAYSDVKLLRPDAYLAFSQIAAADAADVFAEVADDLAGCCVVPDAHVVATAPVGSEAQMQDTCNRLRRVFRSLRWALPFVDTPDGILRTPMPPSSLRSRLCHAILPVARCLLLLFALYRRDLLLMAATFLLPDLPLLLRSHRRSFPQVLRCWIRLPVSAATSIIAAHQALRSATHIRNTSAASVNWQQTELWTQCSACLICAIFAAAPGLWLPALLPAGLFAVFPLIHVIDSRRLVRYEPLSAASEPALARFAALTWRGILHHASTADSIIPPSWTQLLSGQVTSGGITPRSIGMFLLSIVSAKELQLIRTGIAGTYVHQLVDLLERLPFRNGLPVACWSLKDLAPSPDIADARSCGVLLAALMTAAQAMRSWLPDLDPAHRGDSARLDALAQAIDIHRYYDASARLLYEALDRDGQGIGHILHFHDEALLLSLAGCSRGQIPPEHFRQLSRTAIEACGEHLPLTQHGDLAASLLAGLFVPLHHPTADRVIWLQQQHGVSGLWGRSTSAGSAVTHRLRYREQPFGLPEIASEGCCAEPVFAPYAAALALPFCPEAAARCLIAMEQFGALGPHGFCEALDMTGGEPSLIQLHDTFHQGVLLCALAHALCDGPVRRHFCAIPEVEACLPLLRAHHTPAILPPRPFRLLSSPPRDLPARSCRQHTTPVDAHMTGNRKACLAVNQLGSTMMLSDDIPLTHFTGDPDALEGLQVYVTLQGQVCRMFDPASGAQAMFNSASILCEQPLSSLRLRLTITADVASGQFLHLLEVTNMSAEDCLFEAASFLLPDLHAAPMHLEALHPDAQHAVLHDRLTGRSLHHHLTSTIPPLQLTCMTHSDAFLGRGRTSANPASLEEPAFSPAQAEYLPDVSTSDCVSFRAQYLLGGRSRIRLLFTTSLLDAAPPAWDALPGISALCTLHARAIAEELHLSHDLCLTASRMTGPLLWRGQPHQCAVPLVEGHMTELLYGMSGPLIVLTMPDEAALPRLRECLSAAAWLALHGVSPAVYVLCTEQTQHLAEVLTTQASHAGVPYTVLADPSEEARNTLMAAARLIIHGDGRALSAQIDQLPHNRTLLSPPAIPPAGTLPAIPLVNAGGYGGFDPDNGDYLIRLAAGQTTPAPWPLYLQSSQFSCTADETGFRSPLEERVLISLNGAAPFDLLSAGLPCIIRRSCGRIRWQVFTRDVTFTLDAACLPDHPCALRTLRMRNISHTPCQLFLAISARHPGIPLQHMRIDDDGIILSSATDSHCLLPVEDAWHAAPWEAHLPVISCRALPPVLWEEFSLTPSASHRASWLAGHDINECRKARHAIREHGTTQAIRNAAAQAVHPLHTLTILTSESTFDLLFTHLLHRQLLDSRQAIPLPLAAITDPAALRKRLVHLAGAEDPLTFTIHVAFCLSGACDISILDESLNQSGTIRDLCRSTLLAFEFPSDPSDADVCRFFLALFAASVIGRAEPDDALADHRRRLLARSDAMLWQQDHFGTDDRLLLDVQSCAALAHGDTPRIRRCLDACWHTLYDPVHGLIRQQLPGNAPDCPGTPHNGGQLTRSAVLYLGALCMIRERGRAWELLRALNPLHHCDDPVRSEAYALPPYLLPHGMHASPSAPGRAQGVDDESAELLMGVILHALLGLHRTAAGLVMSPFVPPDWDEFSVVIRQGASEWHLSAERGIDQLLLDSKPHPGEALVLHDDGATHYFHQPITT